MSDIVRAMLLGEKTSIIQQDMELAMNVGLMWYLTENNLCAPWRHKEVQ